VEESCRILELQDKKAYFIHFRPLAQLLPAGMSCGNPRCTVSLLSLLQGKSDDCGVFNEEVMHEKWMPPEAIGGMPSENPSV